MNLKYILSCIEELQTALQGTVSLSVLQFAGLQIRASWFYKNKLITWQYVVSRPEIELINDNSAFVLYLIEMAKSEYALQTRELDDE